MLRLYLAGDGLIDMLYKWHLPSIRYYSDLTAFHCSCFLKCREWKCTWWSKQWVKFNLWLFDGGMFIEAAEDGWIKVSILKQHLKAPGKEGVILLGQIFPELAGTSNFVNQTINLGCRWSFEPDSEEYLDKRKCIKLEKGQTNHQLNFRMTNLFYSARLSKPGMHFQLAKLAII